MKINQIIKERRKKQRLTQEQIAEYLGVSIPAVSKWEKDNLFGVGGSGQLSCHALNADGKDYS